MKKFKSLAVVLMSMLLMCACGPSGSETPTTSSTPTTTDVSNPSSEAQHVHTLVKHAAKASTCIEQGNTEYYECSECGLFFSDAAGTNQIEEDSWLLPLGDHTLVEHAARAATCAEPGNTLYYSCSVCGKYFSDSAGEHEILENSWVIPVIDHDFDYENAVIVEPTVDKEGTKTVKCKVCNETIVYKLARLTALTMESTTVKWDVVFDDTPEEGEATSYKVKLDGVLVEEVGPTVIEYNLRDMAIGEHEIEVVAVFDDPNYVEYKGGVKTVNVSLGEQTVNKTSKFKPAYNGAGSFELIDKDGEEVLKLNANGGVNWEHNNYNVSTLYGPRLKFPAGTYKVKIDVMLGEVSENQSFYFGSFINAESGWFPAYRQPVALTTASTTEWKTVETEFVIDADKTGAMEIAFGSLATGLTENSFLLVKNARFLRVLEGDELTQVLNVFPRECAFSGWVDGVYNGRAQNTVAFEYHDGLYVLKTYTEESNIPFTLSCHSSVIDAVGTYRLTMKVKLGPAATGVNNIGFRTTVQSGFTKPWQGDTVFNLAPLEGAHDDFVTLTYNINVTDASNTGWMNLDFWIFTHNNEIQNPDNYVLVSEIALRKVVVV